MMRSLYEGTYRLIVNVPAISVIHAAAIPSVYGHEHVNALHDPLCVTDAADPVKDAVDAVSQLWNASVNVPCVDATPVLEERSYLKKRARPRTARAIVLSAYDHLRKLMYQSMHRHGIRDGAHHLALWRRSDYLG
jgi:hypothetical protein